MQTADGFGLEGGGPIHTNNGVPAGSRLAKYLGNNRSAGSGMNANVASFVPQFAQMSMGDSSNAHNAPQQRQSPFAVSAAPFIPMSNSNLSVATDQLQPYQDLGGTTYFYGNGSATSPVPEIPIAHTSGSFSYQGPFPHVGKFRPKGNMSQFISQDIKSELVHRQLAMESRADPNVYPDVPQHVEHLNNFMPLESLNTHAAQTVFKAVSVRDGATYCVRRIHNYRPMSPKMLQPLENWKKLININVVQLREVIPNSRAFGDTSLLLVYDYYPLADTLKSRHFGRMGSGSFMDGLSGAKISSPHSHNSINGAMPEPQLWSYVMQISSALRAIHSSGLAARCIDASKIIVHGSNKILLACCGIADIVAPEPQQSIQQQQMEDLHALGRLVLCLATGNASAARRDLLQQSMNYVNQHYSMDMKNLISFLLSSNVRKSINEVMPMIGARFYQQLETLQARNDLLENELSKELENGRLFRLVCKLNAIVERPEHNMDPMWAETGDRFLLKLFRDYVFHQVMENGKPWLDMAHMIQCLNKLDAGVSEKIELISRDGENLIIVSYGDLRRCIENSFRDLCCMTSVVGRH